jgi:hypothetical protein
MKLWFSGRVMEGGPNLEFNGIFDSEDLAVKACTTPNDFVSEVALNERAPEESIAFPFSYFPIRREQDDDKLPTIPPQLDPAAAASQSRPSPTGPIG